MTAPSPSVSLSFYNARSLARHVMSLSRPFSRVNNRHAIRKRGGGRLPCFRMLQKNFDDERKKKQMRWQQNITNSRTTLFHYYIDGFRYSIPRRLYTHSQWLCTKTLPTGCSIDFQPERVRFSSSLLLSSLTCIFIYEKREWARRIFLLSLEFSSSYVSECVCVCLTNTFKSHASNFSGAFLLSILICYSIALHKSRSLCSLSLSFFLYRLCINQRWWKRSLSLSWCLFIFQ